MYHCRTPVANQSHKSLTTQTLGNTNRRFVKLCVLCPKHLLASVLQTDARRCTAQRSQGAPQGPFPGPPRDKKMQRCLDTGCTKIFDLCHLRCAVHLLAPKGHTSSCAVPKFCSAKLRLHKSKICVRTQKELPCVYLHRRCTASSCRASTMQVGARTHVPRICKRFVCTHVWMMHHF